GGQSDDNNSGWLEIISRLFIKTASRALIVLPPCGWRRRKRGASAMRSRGPTKTRWVTRDARVSFSLLSTMYGNRRGGPSNLELAIMLGSLINPNATTRPCTQCHRAVPKTQVLLTCDQCREKKKGQKARRKERDQAIEAGRSEAGFSSAPLLAVVAKQEAETVAKRAARRKDKGAGETPAAPAASGSGSGVGPQNMAFVYQAILNEHQRAAVAPKKKPAAKKAAEAAGTKRKLKDIDRGPPYDDETAKKRLRGDMPMPKLEPILGPENERKPVAKTSTVPKPTPLTTQSSNLPTAAKTVTGAKPQKVQTSLVGWMKPAPKSSA
ncbi:hypothetical protein FB451DRAFT_100978, partial [Mycena latifolia]